MPVWEEHAYTRRGEDGKLISLEEYYKLHPQKAFTVADFKLYAICGVGFMLDAYDLFIVNLASPIWAYEFFSGNTPVDSITVASAPAIPFLLRGAVNAAANIGNVIGQISFGFLGDAFGRKFVYGKELIIAIVGIIMIIALPVHNSPGLTDGVSKMWWLFGFRLLLGIGIGGDYPMSAAIVAERSTIKNRGRMLGWIFSNQGWGTLAASVVTCILLAIFQKPLTSGAFSQIDTIWRLQIGLALIPCIALLYFRLTMPESNKFLQSCELSAVNTSSGSSLEVGRSNGEKKIDNATEAGVTPQSGTVLDAGNRRASVAEAALAAAAAQENKKAQMYAFIEYFKKPRHALTLFGCAASWFLVDVAFYGVNLNQSVILAEIGYATGKTPYEYLLHNAEGNLIIAVAGYVPGYFLTIAFIEILGRKWIQIQGFLITALTFGILAGAPWLSSGARFALLVITQLFLNGGPNATTFIIPGEVFPSRVRGVAHGFCAAVGKLGAILSGIGFNYWSQSDHVKYPGSIGLSGVLWIFFACQLLGAIVTFFCVPETKGRDSDAEDFEEYAARVGGQ
ncbi:major facilitator superfamily domain-containing protein [Microdochium trichocladiopsis]|uniref:Major facilitator superfamily domain-containing protein n=1 Tax=Microdochium trichocladiopsis TaxID=1682393 RepID=A0A9P8XY29_9PEZI|nr:major facilitator superfamily domain-containing protein [Microdochium trichocladiopsis]KAH7024680.1 major facilitator superfamily domain-containing protein [Microdochium trichocladiopsis]